MALKVSKWKWNVHIVSKHPKIELKLSNRDVTLRCSYGVNSKHFLQNILHVRQFLHLRVIWFRLLQATKEKRDLGKRISVEVICRGRRLFDPIHLRGKGFSRNWIPIHKFWIFGEMVHEKRPTVLLMCNFLYRFRGHAQKEIWGQEFLIPFRLTNTRLDLHNIPWAKPEWSVSLCWWYLARKMLVDFFLKFSLNLGVYGQMVCSEAQCCTGCLIASKKEYHNLPLHFLQNTS